jgi:hypothetical protein
MHKELLGTYVNIGNLCVYWELMCILGTFGGLGCSNKANAGATAVLPGCVLA